METLFDKLLNKFSDTLRDFNLGYPVTEKSISELWELIQVIELLRFDNLDRKELVKILKHYE